MSYRNIAFYLAFTLCFSILSKVNGQTSEMRWMSSVSAVFFDYQGPLTGDYYQYRTFSPGVQFGASAFATKWLNISVNSSFLPEVNYPQRNFPVTFPDSVSYRNTSLVDVNTLLELKSNGTVLREDFIVAPYIAGGFGVNSASNNLRMYAPAAVGVNIQFGPRFNMRLQSMYKFNVEKNSNPDSFQPMTHSVGFVFGIGQKKDKVEEPPKPDPIEEPDEPIVAEVIDSDGDGIPDKDDRCPDVKGLIMYLGCPPTEVDPEPEEPIITQNDPQINEDPYMDDEGIVEDTYPTEPAYSGPISADDAAELKAATENVFFQPGSDELTPGSLPTLDRISDILRKYPNYGLAIAGYTDNSGNQKDNKTLSVKRAFEVKYYLVYKRGISMKRITSNGYGSENPIADNSTASGRKKNRRVEFKLMQPGYKVPKIF